MTSEQKVGWIGRLTGAGHGEGTFGLESDRRCRLRYDLVVGRSTAVCLPFGLHGCLAQLWCRGIGPIMERTIQSVNGRQWKVIGIG